MPRYGPDTVNWELKVLNTSSLLTNLQIPLLDQSTLLRAREVGNANKVSLAANMVFSYQDVSKFNERDF
jgi:hypothetical protein